jgi:hypothetical protein
MSGRRLYPESARVAMTEAEREVFARGVTSYVERKAKREKVSVADVERRLARDEKAQENARSAGERAVLKSRGPKLSAKERTLNLFEAHG